jgi:hypothetical protein
VTSPAPPPAPYDGAVLEVGWLLVSTSRMASWNVLRIARGEIFFFNPSSAQMALKGPASAEWTEAPSHGWEQKIALLHRTRVELLVDVPSQHVHDEVRDLEEQGPTASRAWARDAPLERLCSTRGSFGTQSYVSEHE